MDLGVVVGGQLSDRLVDAGEQALGIALLHQNTVGLGLRPIHNALKHLELDIDGIGIVAAVAAAAGHKAQRRDQGKNQTHQLFHHSYLTSLF